MKALYRRKKISQGANVGLYAIDNLSLPFYIMIWVNGIDYSTFTKQKWFTDMK
jgi:hypothetical protein